jgi:pantoate kinase
VVVIKNNVLSKVSLPQGFGYSSGSCAFAFAAAAAGLAGFGFGFAALCHLIYCVVIIKSALLVIF